MFKATHDLTGQWKKSESSIEYKKLRNASRYPVRLSPKLEELKRQLTQQLKGNENKL